MKGQFLCSLQVLKHKLLWQTQANSTDCKIEQGNIFRELNSSRKLHQSDPLHH